MDCGKTRAIRNFIEYSTRPFTAETVSQETGLELSYVKKILQFLRDTQVVQVISKEGKWNIYVKDTTPDDEKPLNRYGYQKDFMKRIMIELINNHHTSQRELGESVGLSRDKLVYYFAAMVSAGVIGIRDGQYVVTDSGNIGAVGMDVDSKIVRKLRKRASQTPGVAVTA